MLTTVAISCVVSVAAPLQAWASPATRNQPATLEQVQQELDGLYHSAEVATDAYNAAKQKADQQSRSVTALQRQMARSKSRLQQLTAQAGAAARAQYSGAGLPPEIQLILGSDPQGTLDNAAQTNQIQLGVVQLISSVDAEKKSLQTKSAQAARRLRELRAVQQKKSEAKRTIEDRIAKAHAIEEHLAAEQLKSLQKREAESAAKAQAQWASSGILKKLGSATSAAGKKAVAFATAQIGKPYVWGAAGPNSFDCSGLTSQAWAAAGHPIPRTSQEQWRQLPHVNMDQMRPGDLVIYFTDASHVGMYIGGGEIVHAPRPGRTVTTAPVASMQILGVVRPGR
ncbi:glycoside hydrolase [Streptomyces thermoviolaceus subsp. thermoviolaceus]|uniref:Glycoside hydrolase n=1 Tax=Streptomyces thermoviolaceus subsp. thermoviolaceus TaxID=66860 RepID=A0ABX0YR28_STRTL|nr:C40 family peptidase [Streptomyces thermoviolaceus]NJP14538.1 glycoside hydrolase [Streptomyces thermoviolaceus subsp. thermoviolaceus]